MRGMTEPWDGLDAEEAAVMMGEELVGLDARMQVVASARAAAVKQMRAEGLSVRRICDALGLSRWVVCELLKQRPQRSAGATPPNTP